MILGAVRSRGGIRAGISISASQSEIKRAFGAHAFGTGNAVDEPDPKEPHEPLITQPVSVVRERGASLLHDAWFNKVSMDDADDVQCLLYPCIPLVSRFP